MPLPSLMFPIIGCILMGLATLTFGTDLANILYSSPPLANEAPQLPWNEDDNPAAHTDVAAIIETLNTHARTHTHTNSLCFQWRRLRGFASLFVVSGVVLLMKWEDILFVKIESLWFFNGSLWGRELFEALTATESGGLNLVQFFLEHVLLLVIDFCAFLSFFCILKLEHNLSIYFK